MIIRSFILSMIFPIIKRNKRLRINNYCAPLVSTPSGCLVSNFSDM